MEGIAHLVSASLARHGYVTQVDHRRLQWSKWFRCESSFSALLVPSKPGLFALAEEAPGSDTSVQDEKRTLTLLAISETEDLGMALGGLFFPDAPERELLAKKRCYARYAVIEDSDQRRASYRSLRAWMSSSSDVSTEIANTVTVHTFAKDQQSPEDAEKSLPLIRTGTGG